MNTSFKSTTIDSICHGLPLLCSLFPSLRALAVCQGTDSSFRLVCHRCSSRASDCSVCCCCCRNAYQALKEAHGGLFLRVPFWQGGFKGKPKKQKTPISDLLHVETLTGVNSWANMNSQTGSQVPLKEKKKATAGCTVTCSNGNLLCQADPRAIDSSVRLISLLLFFLGNSQELAGHPSSQGPQLKIGMTANSPAVVAHSRMQPRLLEQGVDLHPHLLACFRFHPEGQPQLFSQLQWAIPSAVPVKSCTPLQIKHTAALKPSACRGTRTGNSIRSLRIPFPAHGKRHLDIERKPFPLSIPGYLRIQCLPA